jgi:diguanylate cyclase (GGDEF)-like protein
MTSHENSTPAESASRGTCATTVGEVEPGRRQPHQVKLLAAFACVGLIGFLDYFTGAEIRIFPLYYFPISLGAWYTGRRGAVLLSLFGSMIWMFSNSLAGLRFSTAWIWVVNTLAQTCSLLLVALLINVLKAARDEEKRLASHDGLTGLLNTRAFYQLLQREVSASLRYDYPITLGYMDLDSFKAVNDTSGHREGDALLRRVAEILMRSTRKTDVVARLGGDEFVILLPHTDALQSRTVFDRIISALKETMEAGRWPVTASVGVATFRKPPDDPEALVQKVDAAMYAAKQSGKNRIEYVAA